MCKWSKGFLRGTINFLFGLAWAIDPITQIVSLHLIPFNNGPGSIYPEKLLPIF